MKFTMRFLCIILFCIYVPHIPQTPFIDRFSYLGLMGTEETLLAILLKVLFFFYFFILFFFF